MNKIFEDFDEILSLYKDVAPSTTKAFRKWIKKYAKNIPINFVHFNKHLPSHIKTFTNNKGVFLNQDNFKVFFNSQVSIPLIVYEVCYFKTLNKTLLNISDATQIGFEDFYNAINLTNVESIECFKNNMKIINSYAGNKPETGFFNKNLNLNDMTFLKTLYSSFLKNKDKYKSIFDFMYEYYIGNYKKNTEEELKIRKMIRKEIVFSNIEDFFKKINFKNIKEINKEISEDFYIDKLFGVSNKNNKHKKEIGYMIDFWDDGNVFFNTTPFSKDDLRYNSIYDETEMSKEFIETIINNNLNNEEFFDLLCKKTNGKSCEINPNIPDDINKDYNPLNYSKKELEERLYELNRDYEDGVKDKGHIEKINYISILLKKEKNKYLSLDKLSYLLQKAIDEEKYEEAAEIRDAIKKKN